MSARLVLGLVAAGTCAGLALVAATPPPPASAVRVAVPVPVLRPVTVTTAPPAPPPVRAAGCAPDPSRVGAPLEGPIPEGPIPAGAWRVATSRGACVIAVWTPAAIYASWDDGATFAPVLASASPVASVAIRDDGAVFALHEDFRLGVARADGSTSWRRLTFAGDLATSGRWLVVLGGSPALSDDDGATWRHLASPGDWVDDLRVLADGTIVATVDDSASACDHFGCAPGAVGPGETDLDGRPWRPATPRHARALAPPRPAAVPSGAQLPRGENGWVLPLDAHRLPVDVFDGRYVARYTPRGWRLLFAGGAS